MRAVPRISKPVRLKTIVAEVDRLFDRARQWPAGSGLSMKLGDMRPTVGRSRFSCKGRALGLPLGMSWPWGIEARGLQAGCVEPIPELKIRHPLTIARAQTITALYNDAELIRTLTWRHQFSKWVPRRRRRAPNRLALADGSSSLFSKLKSTLSRLGTPTMLAFAWIGGGYTLALTRLSQSSPQFYIVAFQY